MNQPSRSHAVTVPFDVLYSVMTAADRAAMLALSGTCQTLRAEGFAQAMKDGYVRVPFSDAAAESFLAFCYAVLTKGMRAITHHTLEFVLPTIADPKSATMAVTALRSMTMLHTLKLVDPEQSLSRHPEFGAALASLQSLRHLTVVEAGPYTYDLLQALVSPLTRLKVYCSSSATPLRIEPVLGHLGTSLKELMVYPHFQFVEDYGAQPVAAVFPHLERLWVPSWALPVSAGLMWAFPKLRMLDVGGQGPTSHPPTSHQREFNRHWTAQLLDTIEANNDPTWEDLQLIRGSLSTLMTYGLTWGVYTLEVIGVVPLTDIKLLPTVVGDVNPTTLRIGLSAPLSGYDFKTLPDQDLLHDIQQVSVKVHLRRGTTFKDLVRGVRRFIRLFPQICCCFIHFEYTDDAVGAAGIIEQLSSYYTEYIPQFVQAFIMPVQCLCVSFPGQSRCWSNYYQGQLYVIPIEIPAQAGYEIMDGTGMLSPKFAMGGFTRD